jgi:hypothetical protein
VVTEKNIKLKCLVIIENVQDVDHLWLVTNIADNYLNEFFNEKYHENIDNTK